MTYTHVSHEFIEKAIDLFDAVADVRGITFPEENVRGQAFDDFLKQAVEGVEFPQINMFEGMTCERSHDWMIQSFEI